MGTNEHFSIKLKLQLKEILKCMPNSFKLHRSALPYFPTFNTKIDFLRSILRQTNEITS